nr:MAG TPA: hypothetical protein [Bacteriophage sp.]
MAGLYSGRFSLIDPICPIIQVPIFPVPGRSRVVDFPHSEFSKLPRLIISLPNRALL